jgi:hypothetical protein
MSAHVACETWPMSVDRGDEIVSAIRAALPATVSPWEVNARRRDKGAWTVELTHEASNGLVFETPDVEVTDAITRMSTYIAENDEVQRIARAPRLDHPEAVAGVRVLVQTFGWSRAEVAGVAGVLRDVGALNHEEEYWLGTSFGSDRPPPRATTVV